MEALLTSFGRFSVSAWLADGAEYEEDPVERLSMQWMGMPAFSQEWDDA